jgi:hypothetical protein
VGIDYDGGVDDGREGALMALTEGTAYDLIEHIRRRAPEYLDLLTAESDEQFDRAFDLWLEKAIRGLEANKSLFADLDEEGLSAVLAQALTMPGLVVSQEQHSNGHVDLTIEAVHSFPARVRLGEAKIYDGARRHYGGLDQLLGRYSTGRDRRGLLIVYFRKADIETLIKELRKRMDSDLPHGQQVPQRITSSDGRFYQHTGIPVVTTLPLAISDATSMWARQMRSHSA